MCDSHFETFGSTLPKHINLSDELKNSNNDVSEASTYTKSLGEELRSAPKKLLMKKRGDQIPTNVELSEITPDVRMFQQTLKKYREWVLNYQKYPSDIVSDYDERELAIWAVDIRTHRQTLDSYQVVALDNTDIWYWEQNDICVMSTYIKVLKVYHDTLKLPTFTKDANGHRSPLGMWCSKQRAKYRNGKLPLFLASKLEKIPIWVWDGNDGKDMRSFDEKFEDVVEFVRIMRSLPDEISDNLNEAHLGRWCRTQKEYKKAETLKADRILRLEAIEGWQWYEKTFDSRPFLIKYEELKDYIESNKRFPSSRSPDPRIRRLDYFCHRLRELNTDGKLEIDKINLLEKIEGWWWPENVLQHKSFDVVIEELRSWVLKNKRIPVQCATDPLEHYLGGWCSRNRVAYRLRSLDTDQREKYKIKSLSDDCVRKLELIPHWDWSPLNRNGYSAIALEWLKEMETEYGPLRTILSPNREFPITGTGYCENTNTVFEMLGDYWHGNPLIYKDTDIHPVRKITYYDGFERKQRKATYGELYIEVINREATIRASSFNYISIWESDYIKSKCSKLDSRPPKIKLQLKIE
jgi:hypothetical protein